MHRSCFRAGRSNIANDTHFERRGTFGLHLYGAAFTDEETMSLKAEGDEVSERMPVRSTCTDTSLEAGSSVASGYRKLVALSPRPPRWAAL